VKHSIIPAEAAGPTSEPMPALTRLARTLLLHPLRKLRHGRLRLWRERFMARHSEVQALGYAENFVRMWEYYLCYCEGGFEERQLGDVQMLLTKPRSRRASIAVVNAAPA